MSPYSFNSFPYQQQNNFFTPNFQNYRTPFSIPRSSFNYINPMVGKINGKFTINKFLAGAENMISTVNQVIPIYQQVKPLWDNTKNFRNKLKNFNPFNNRNTQIQNVVKEIYAGGSIKVRITNDLDTLKLYLESLPGKLPDNALPSDDVCRV